MIFCLPFPVPGSETIGGWFLKRSKFPTPGSVIPLSFPGTSQFLIHVPTPAYKIFIATWETSTSQKLDGSASLEFGEIGRYVIITEFKSSYILDIKKLIPTVRRMSTT